MTLANPPSPTLPSIDRFHCIGGDRDCIIELHSNDKEGARRAAAKSQLHFDAETHRYTFNGRELPSVTQIINAIVPGWQADPWYLGRGAALHHGCRLLDEGRLDWSSVSDEIIGRLRGWQKFRSDFTMECQWIERAEHHPTWGFAGTLDRVFADSSERVIADIKHSIAPQVKLQLAAYRILHATNVNGPTIASAVAVELRDNGTYSCLWMNRRDLDLAEREFLACLTIFNFKRKEGIK